MTLQQHLRIPPFAYRLIAKARVSGQRYRPLSLRGISQQSGLSQQRVMVLSQRQDWVGVPVDVIDQFIVGCGYDPMRQERALEYLKRILITSRRGLSGTRALRQTLDMPIWERAARIKQLKRLKKLLLIKNLEPVYE